MTKAKDVLAWILDVGCIGHSLFIGNAAQTTALPVTSFVTAILQFLLQSSEQLEAHAVDAQSFNQLQAEHTLLREGLFKLDTSRGDLAGQVDNLRDMLKDAAQVNTDWGVDSIGLLVTGFDLLCLPGHLDGVKGFGRVSGSDLGCW